MKNTALFLALAILMVGCSSGTTVSDLPSNVTSRFVGTFVNTPNTQNGTVTLDLSETNGVVTGNIIFESAGANCLKNSTVSGTNTGFNMNLEAAQVSRVYTQEITEREPDVVEFDELGVEIGRTAGALVSQRTVLSSTGTVGTTITTLSNGNVVTRVTSVSDVTGTLTMQLAVANAGNTLNGTYVVNAGTSTSTCSNATGSGTMNLNR